MAREETTENPRLLAPSAALNSFNPARGAIVGLKPVLRQRIRYGFRMGNMGFLIDIDTVSEVVERATVYPVPQTPPWLVGLLNLRGNLVPVFDFKASLSLDNVAPDNHYLLLLGEGGDMVGFFVESLPQTVDTSHKLAHPPPLPAALRGYAGDIYSFDKIVWVEFDHRNFFQSLAASAVTAYFYRS